MKIAPLSSYLPGDVEALISGASGVNPDSLPKQIPRKTRVLFISGDPEQWRQIESLVREISGSGASPNLQATEFELHCVLNAPNVTTLAEENAADVVVIDGEALRAAGQAWAEEIDAPLVVLGESADALSGFAAGEEIEILARGELSGRVLTRAIAVARARHEASAQLRAARDHNTRLETAICSAGLGVMLARTQIDTAGRLQPIISYVNPAFERITGYLRGEVIGKSGHFLQGEATDEAARRALDAAIAAGEPLGVTLLNYRKDGTPFWNALQIAPLRDVQGEIFEWVSLINDESARIEAEIALRESQENLAAAQQLTHFGSWKYDLTASGEEARLFWSDEVFRILGFAPQEVTPSSDLYHSLIHPEDREKARQLEDAIRQRQSCDLEYRMVRLDGQERTVQVHATIERGEAEVPTGVLGTVWDITERFHAEKLAREAQHHLQMTLHHAPVIIWALDHAGRVTFAGGQALRLLPESCAEQEGRSIFEIFPGNAALEGLARRALEGEDSHGTIEFGDLFFDARFGALRDENGEPSGAVGIATDISERERAKRELEASEARFGRIVANAPGMVYRFRIDRDGSYSLPFASDGCQVIYGLDSASIRARPQILVESIDPDERDAFHASILASARDLSPWNWESRIQRPDGEFRWVRGQARPERQDDGSTVWDGLIMDVSAQRRAQDEIVRSRRALDEAQQLAHIGSFEWNLESGEIFWSDELFRIFGLQRDDFSPTLEALFEFIVPAEREAARGRAVQAVRTASPESMIIPVTRIDGEVRWLQTHTRVESNAQGRSIYIVGSAQDITETLEAGRALRESEQRYALAAQGANDGLWDWNLETNQIYFSPRWKSMLGWAEDEIGDAPSEWLERVHPEDGERLHATLAAHLSGQAPHFECEYRVRCADDTYRWMLCRALAVWGRDRENSPVALRIAGSQTDISERKAAEDELSRNAFYDRLTGLPNRALFLDRLERALSRAHRHPDYGFATLFLDIDRFKKINDTLGHHAGDQLLIEAAARFATCLRPGDTVARLGGDEFAMLVDDIHGGGDVPLVAQRIQRELEQPFLVEGKEIFVTVSIGMAPYSGGEITPDDLLRNADSAMYRAKALGRARSEIFDSATHEHALNLLELETDLWQAIDRDELCLFYQPIIALESGGISGYEALVRWRHPTRGLIPPADFIPIAEENGFILLLGWWVLETACRQIREWNELRAARFPGERAHFISVNLSSKQFSQPDMIPHVSRILERTGADPRRLTLEITESVIMEHTESASATLRGLRRMGIHLAMDDFGTGYSSLSYLHRFSLDTLKIDRSFISQMRVGAREGEIVNTILSLASSLHMKVVAEGVETAEQLAALRRMGCGFAQGFLMARPLPADKIENLWHSAPIW